MHLPNTLTFNGQWLESPAQPTTFAPQNPLTSTHTTDLKQQPDGAFFVRVTHFNPYCVGVSTPHKDRPVAHGMLSGISTKTVREVEIHFEIVAKTLEGQQCGIDVLQAILRPDPCPSYARIGAFELSWETLKDGAPQERFLTAQVTDFLPKPMFDDATCFITPLVAKLFATDPRVFARPLVTVVNVSEGAVGGLDLGNIDDNETYGNEALHDVWNPTILNYDGLDKTPLRVTITVDPTWVDARTLPPHPSGAYAPVAPAINPTLWNLTTSSGFRVPVTLQLGDTLTINSMTSTVLLNGAPVPNATVGNVFPSLVPGLNTLVLADDTHFHLHGAALTATVEYFDVVG